MRKLKVLIIGLLFSPSCVFAMTVVDDVQVDTTWNAQDSPYLLNDPFIIYPGVNLVIDPGVVVKVRQGGVFIVRGGNLTINGVSTNPVYITSELDDSVGGDTNQDGVITTPGVGDWVGIEAEGGSQINITNSFIKYTGGLQHINPAIKNYGILNLNSSIISDGSVGIQNVSGTSTLQNLNINNHGSAISVGGGLLSIHNSNINSVFSGIDNFSLNSVDATNNWWGDASGPFNLTTNSNGLGVSVSDNVLFVPWLGLPYNSNSTTTICCSSVLFLPGFMASDLYVQSSTFENQLWPPTSLLQQDIDKLKLDAQGNPVTPGIYTKGIVEEAFGVNFYKNFADRMRLLVQTHGIEEWLPFPYDWRKDLSEVVNNFTLVKVGNNFDNKKLIDEAVALAQRSPTGKITIIGHSNGGLVGKYLIKELVNQGKGDLIDQFIMVATPQLGTPKAVSSLLHGDEQEIPEGLGFLVGKDNARSLGKNLQSSYNLFPNKSYFQNNTSSVIDFDPSIRNVFDYSLYNLPQTISSYDDLISFVTLLDRGSVEGDPTDIPAILRLDLLNNANSNTENLLSWIVPDTVRAYYFVGVGQQTTNGIEYKSKEDVICKTQNGIYSCNKEYFWDRLLNKSFDGDGTVISQSAEFMNGNSSKVYFFDMFNSNKDLLLNIKHNNILENLNILQLTENIILSKSNNSLPTYISQSKPNFPNSYQQLSVHSPVNISVYDKVGNLVGIDSSRQGGDFVFISEDIPNSDYTEINDQKYITVPMGVSYVVNLEGKGIGTFTLNIDQYENGTSSHKSFVNVPVSSLLTAEVNIGEDNLVGDLNIDMNGDKIIDLAIAHQEVFDPIMYLKMLKGVIKNFDLKKSQENKLIKDINIFVELINLSKKEKVNEKIIKYNKYLNELLLKDREKDGFNKNEIQLLIRYLELLRINL